MSARNLSLFIALIGLSALFLPGFQGGLVLGEESDPIILRSISIDTSIDNAYAVTEITHTYENPDSDPAEAVFSLSIPEKAFISNFSLTLGNQTHYADVLTKAEAREKYEEAVGSGKTAGLGEAEDLTSFSFSVNLPANSTASATLRYEQYIPRFLGERTYPLFLSSMEVQPESFKFRMEISSIAGITGLGIDNYDDVLDRQWESVNDLILTSHLSGTDVDIQEDLFIQFTESSMPVNGSLVGYYDEGSGEYYFLNVFSPMKDDIGGNFPKDIVFVLDRSGSMGVTKMDQMKDSFSEILDQLSENDKFGIVMFDTNVEVFNTALDSASNATKQQAKEYLNGQDSGGGTNLNGGLEQALAMLTYNEARAPIIVLLTDGMPTAGEIQEPFLIRSNIKDENTGLLCPIFTLGFGTDPDDFDLEFLTALSLENNAKAQHIHPSQDVSEQIGDFYETISTTLLKHIEIEYEGGSYQHFPDEISALYEGSESVIVGKLLALDGQNDTITSNFTAKTPEGSRQFMTIHLISTNDTEHDSVLRVWSYTRIYQLIDQLAITPPSEQDEMIQQIENLSIEAHFVTPYTSLYLEIEQEEEEGDDDDDDGDDDDTTYSSDKDTQGGSDPDTVAAPPYNPPQPTGGGKLGTPGPAPDGNEGDMDSGFAGDPAYVSIMPIMSFIIATIAIVVMTSRSKAKNEKKLK